ncbi:MAG: ATP-binding protein [Halanaerobiales bacterium]
MKELSLHILDIMQNSIAAGANTIELKIIEKKELDKFIIEIGDDGKGMEKKERDKVTDPFVTSRNTREVGLGLPLFKKAALQCEGDFKIESYPDRGTRIKAEFTHDHIDRAPLGDIAGTITGIIGSNPDLHIIYKHRVDQKQFEINTKFIKNEIENIQLNHPEILNWIKDYINENLENIGGGE